MMEQPTKHVLSVEWDIASGQTKFHVPENAVIAGGLFAMLEAVVKIRVIGPAIMPAVVPATGMPPGFPMPS